MAPFLEVAVVVRCCDRSWSFVRLCSARLHEHGFSFPAPELVNLSNADFEGICQKRMQVKLIRRSLLSVPQNNRRKKEGVKRSTD